MSDSEVMHDFSLFRVSYCGTDVQHKNVFRWLLGMHGAEHCVMSLLPPSFVAKETDDLFYCHVFQCSSREKAHALALALAKAFYLAYQVSNIPLLSLPVSPPPLCPQILQEQQGEFPRTPERELLFEPQSKDDTTVSPCRPTIPPPLPQPGPEVRGQGT